MLPYIIGAVVVAGVATYLSDKEQSSSSSYNRRLGDEHKEYSNKLANREQRAEREES
jgi:hypothetical protein